MKNLHAVAAWLKQETCARRPRLDSTGVVTRTASVLLLLLPGREGPELLFEVRSGNLRRQPGEICFPGGRIEPGENPEDAAVRESAEELLVPEEHIECIAPLHVLNGPGGSEITSFFGMIHGYKGTYSADEVSRVFALPVKWLLRQKPETYETEYRLYVPENFPYETIPGGSAWSADQRPGLRS